MLSDKEICQICTETHFPGIECSTTAGCLNIDVDREVAKAQRAATLKEVGEWMEGPCEHSINRQRFQCIRCLLTIKSALQRGEMPEVGE